MDPTRDMPVFATACALALALAHYGVFWLLNRVWDGAAEPEITDPGREAAAALTSPRPFPSGCHRRPSPGAEFEGDVRRAARTTTTTHTTGGTHASR